MKRVIVAFCLIIGILTYSISAIWIIKNENSKLENVLNEIQACCDNNNMSEAAKKAKEFEGLWYSYQKRMSLLVKDDSLRELDTTIAKVRPYIEEANDELKAELQSIRRQLTLIYKSEVPYWYNML